MLLLIAYPGLLHVLFSLSMRESYDFYLGTKVKFRESKKPPQGLIFQSKFGFFRLLKACLCLSSTLSI